MAEQLTKLRPDRDLQCYFQQPTAIAALSQTSATGFTVSGCWRQQFDWAVIEWNRDNVFEHPALRNLPDGNLSGVKLSYLETRTNCIPMDSNLYPTVDWPYLRIWSDVNGVESIYRVNLLNHATPASGYIPATAQMELQGVPTAGDYIELSWLDQHFNYQMTTKDTLNTAAANLAADITENQILGQATATANGAVITLTYLGAPGSNGNRIGVYGTVHGAGTESWANMWAMFTGGTSPATWRVDLDFSSLQDINGVTIPTANVRKLRWTYSADLQASAFLRTEFSVVVSQWTVSGVDLNYLVAGPGSLRIEDSEGQVEYTGTWSDTVGNFSGGSVHSTSNPGASASVEYSMPVAHSLYLGTRYLDGGARIAVALDGGTPVQINLQLAGEDVLARVPLELQLPAGPHSVCVTHAGDPGQSFYFDFFDIVVQSSSVPCYDTVQSTSLATDWDTLHSQAIAPERTAWLMQTLGFRSRVNHYAGALWFYELCPQGHVYASATVTFAGMPVFAPGQATQLTLGPTTIQHANLIGDTSESIAACFALLVNGGSTGVWASANGSVLTIQSRQLGQAGNATTITASTGSSVFTAVTSSARLAGGIDGRWVTDLTATPRINRAARDWSTSFFAALKGYSIPVTASFSMELGNGDDTIAAGIAQRYPCGDAVWLNTPSLQTNFSPASTAFWQQVYMDMAGLMRSAGVTPYLQFGEVQWWYFAAASGMPFYDNYTTSTFQQTYGRTMGIIPSENADPSAYPQECVFLPGLIGNFTHSIMTVVRGTYPDVLFEVLYPPDTNGTALNRVVNLPKNVWTPANLACLKTENFTFTGNRNLTQVQTSIDLPTQLGFSRSQTSHLAGINDYTTPWMKERRLAIAAGVESVVLFALDQFCLIGYPLPLATGIRRSRFLGA